MPDDFEWTVAFERAVSIDEGRDTCAINSSEAHR
jgi:hypothetical protein